MQKSKLLILPILLSASVCALTVTNCSKRTESPYAKLNPGDTYTIHNKKEAELLIKKAKASCDFYSKDSFPIDSTYSESELLIPEFGSSIEKEHAGTRLYWEIANFFATNVKNGEISDFYYSSYDATDPDGKPTVTNFYYENERAAVTLLYYNENNDQIGLNLTYNRDRVSQNVVSDLIFGDMEAEYTSDSLYWNTTIITSSR